MKALMPSSREAELILPGEETIDLIISEHEARYRQIKDKAEPERLEREARWFSLTNDDYQRRREALFQRHRRELDENGVLPPYRYYRESLAPALRELTQDNPQRFRGASELSLKAIETILEQPIPEGATKRFIINSFFAQYFEFLHYESNEVVLGIAAMQGHRANLHAEKEQGPDSPMQDYPFKDWEIQQFLSNFKASGMEKYLPRFAQICAGIDNGHVLGQYLDALPKVLDALSKEDSEVIEKYLRLAQAQKFPADHSTFDFKNPEAVNVIKAFSRAGKYAEKAFELCCTRLEMAKNSSHIGLNIGEVLNEIAEYERSSFSPELPLILEEAIYLSRKGLRGEVYLSFAERIRESTKSGSRPFLEYLLDLSSINVNCADSYLVWGGEEFSLPSRLQEKYHQAGLKVARQFGEAFQDYFNTAAKVLMTLPKSFDSWLEQLANFAETHPHLMQHLSGASLQAIKNYQLSELLEVVDFFDRGVQERNKTFEERVIRLNREADFAGSYSNAKEAGVSPWKHARNALRLLDLEYYGHADNLLSAVGKGIDYDKCVEVFPTLSEHRIFEALPKLKDLINADLNVFEKEKLLTAYHLAHRQVWRECDYPHLEPAGKWLEEFQQKAVEETSKFFDVDTSSFGLEELCFLSSIKSESSLQMRAPEPRLKYIVRAFANGKKFPKNFPLDKSYATVPVDAFGFEEMEIKMQKSELLDLGDGFRMFSQIFYPRGNLKEAALNYVIHGSVGLLQLAPRVNNHLGNPVGTIVAVEAWNGDEKYLLVDSINIGPRVSYEDCRWMEPLHQSILALGKDMKAEAVIYNSQIATGVRSREELFQRYLSQLKGEEAEMELRVAKSDNLTEFLGKEVPKLLDYIGNKPVRQRRRGGGFFGGLSEEEKQWEEEENLQQVLSAYTGLVLQSFGGVDFMRALQEGIVPGRLEGVVQGIKFLL